MKAPILTADAVNVTCPDCDGLIDEPVTGSQMWTPADLERESGRKVRCDCGAWVKMPKRPTRVRLA